MHAIVGTPCGLGRRLLAIAYDAMVVVALLFLAAALALLAGYDRVAFRDAGFTLYLLGTWFVYLAWCWRHAGMTLGMRAWNVRLLTDDGAPLGWRRCAVRFAVALLGAAALGAGYFSSLRDPLRRCWHDLAAGTRLQRVRP